MDKTIIINDGINGTPDIYNLLPKMSPIHKTFGLWICMLGRAGKSFPSQKTAATPNNVPVKPRIFTFYSISHMLDGAGFYWEPENGGKTLRAGDCIVTSPDFLHSYGPYPNNENEPYIEDTVCFTGLIADNLFNSGIIKNGVSHLGTTRRLLPIMDMAINPSRDSQIKANTALQNFLVEIYLESKRESVPNRTTKFELLMKNIFKDPSKWWDVGEMAEYCKLSVSHFRTTFREYSGMAPKLYMDKVKLGIAAEKLKNSNIGIAKLAECLGYIDPYHFSRRFKQVMGISPSKYRELKTKL